jgi:hypothetical protein
MSHEPTRSGGSGRVYSGGASRLPASARRFARARTAWLGCFGSSHRAWVSAACAAGVWPGMVMPYEPEAQRGMRFARIPAAHRDCERQPDASLGFVRHGLGESEACTAPGLRRHARRASGRERSCRTNPKRSEGRCRTLSVGASRLDAAARRFARARTARRRSLARLH